jgi:uncharacterized protein
VGLATTWPCAQDAGARAKATDKQGNAPLHDAAQGASPVIIQALLDQGASLSVHNGAQETPLHIAAKGTAVDTVSTLVRSGAPVRS